METILKGILKNIASPIEMAICTKPTRSGKMETAFIGNPKTIASHSYIRIRISQEMLKPLLREIIKL